MGDGEVWDDGAEESKILGESGGGGAEFDPRFKFVGRINLGVGRGRREGGKERILLLKGNKTKMKTKQKIIFSCLCFFSFATFGSKMNSFLPSPPPLPSFLSFFCPFPERRDWIN